MEAAENIAEEMHLHLELTLHEKTIKEYVSYKVYTIDDSAVLLM